MILGPFAEFNASPGRFYEVRDPQGVQVPLLFRGDYRKGDVVDAPDLDLGRGRMPFLGPQYDLELHGNRWGVGVIVRDHATSGTLTGVLWIALRRPDGTDPLIHANGNVYLDPLVDVPFSMPMASIGVDISHEFSFNNEPAWEGEVVLFQYAFLTPHGAVALSDIFGRAVDGPPSGATSFTSSAVVSTGNETDVRTGLVRAYGALSATTRSIMSRVSPSTRGGEE